MRDGDEYCSLNTLVDVFQYCLLFSRRICPVQQQLRSRTTTFDHLEILLLPKWCWGWYDMVMKSLTKTHPTQEVIFVTSNFL